MMRLDALQTCQVQPVLVPPDMLTEVSRRCEIMSIVGRSCRRKALEDAVEDVCGEKQLGAGWLCRPRR